jgi:hypothetical protein
MDAFPCGDQIIRFDRSLTAVTYKRIPQGDAERCGCSYCLNFAAQRSSAYPEEFRAILDNIGIDHEKEGEVYELGPEAGLRIYGGWFYFAGEVVQSGARNSTIAHFEFWFVNASRLPKPPADFGPNVAAVEFMIKLPWTLASPPEPTD